jgi:hypothetical protein
MESVKAALDLPLRAGRSYGRLFVAGKLREQDVEPISD